MAEESLYPGEQPEARQYGSDFHSSFAPPPPPPPPVAAYELRPLTTGEILDRTFYLYRGNFWLFAGISAVAAGAATLTSIVQLIYNHFNPPAAVASAGLAAIFRSSTAVILSLLATVIYLVIYSVAHAATVSAVTSLYLGDSTSNAQAFRSVKHRWLRYVGIALWQIWSAMWVMFVAFIPIVILARVFAASLGTGGGIALGLTGLLAALGGGVLGLINYIRNSLGVPVEVMEDLSVRKAMRRSKDLAAGTKGRIFLMFLLLMVLYIVAAGVQAPIGMLILKAGPTGRVYLLQILSLFLNFVMTTLVTPVGAIGLCLFYIDQRIRKEGFDIQFMLDRSGPLPVEYPVVEAPITEIP